jgi:hypothetical protein
LSNFAHILAVLAVVCALTALGFVVAVANFLRERGHEANPLFAKWMAFHYVAMYKRVTLKENGAVGPLYHAVSAASAGAILLGLAAIVAINL